ncbi:type I restriction enzyme S subunit [Rhizobium sp. BIGb0125]|uniref:restriction endonuclease subunit S n=1 Tax=Rhizobium sp. BIGb0125 TaxID=2940618 RepID=UPI00216898F1|nr:restriction endonuclease subunit S [Rhizobium sp. BIGb0125]MCS4241938.1 type I restriction enzyme S subunit [Rhizobium sp. BIGb0125]
MNASLLNALSAAISDNTVHVLQLRKIVVALAISGRLNEVDASIGHEEILALLGDVKRRLMSQRVLAKQKPNVAITPDQLPEDFTDPSKFISLGHIARVEKGKTGIQQAKPGPYPLVVTAAERITADHYDFDGAAAIIPLVSSTGHGNASINRLHYQEGQFALGTILAAVLPHDQALFSARFLFEYLSAFKEELLVSRMTGTANVTLTLGRIEEVPIPLVSPVIQQQVDQLMALCDEMEAARTEREMKRDRLAAASLARLNIPDPKTFRDDARFALDALPALTARRDQIKQLRQTILNLAVCGKLVPQDPTDEPAVLPPQKKFAASSGLDVAVFKEFEGTISLPYGWHIAPLARLADNIVDCPHTTPNWTESGIICVRTSQLRSRTLDLSAPRFVSPDEYLERIERLEPKADDILYSREGGILGVACRIPRGVRLCLGQRLMLIRSGAETRADFLEIVLNSPFITDIAKARTTGGAAPRVNMSTVRAYPIPVPPLAEQHRIVVKVDELMALCDQLEASLTSADETRKKLLDALLAEVLARPEADVLREAAE